MQWQKYKCLVPDAQNVRTSLRMHKLPQANGKRAIRWIRLIKHFFPLSVITGVT